MGRMSVLVQKYGGTSLGTPERIRHVAKRAVEAGDRVCVVASAMGDTTDELLGLAGQVSPAPHGRELDMLLSAGEQISIALLSMAIIDLGRDAVSLTRAQAGIHSDTTPGRARIVDVRTDRVPEAIGHGKLVIVAGFQGVSPSQDTTTL